MTDEDLLEPLYLSGLILVEAVLLREYNVFKEGCELLAGDISPGLGTVLRQELVQSAMHATHLLALQHIVLP